MVVFRLLPGSRRVPNRTRIDKVRPTSATVGPESPKVKKTIIAHAFWLISGSILGVVLVKFCVFSKGRVFVAFWYPKSDQNGMLLGPWEVRW